MIAKVWLTPPRVGAPGGFSAVEIREIERIVGEEQRMLLKAWHDFFQR